MTGEPERQHRVVTSAEWMAICKAHPDHSEALALAGGAVLCCGGWPDALSATVHWRAWRALNLNQDSAFSLACVDVADRVLALRETIPPEKHIWGPDAADRIPSHWRNLPEVDALARLEAEKWRGL